MKRIITILILIGCISSIYSKNSTDVGTLQTVKKTNLSNCSPSTSQIDLDINNIRVKLLGAGDMWWDGDVARYEYPKIDQTSGVVSKNVMFLGSLWFTGYDEGTANLRCASQGYYTIGNDFYNGPIRVGGLIDKEVCEAFDQHFNVYGDEIKLFIAEFNASGSIAESNIPDNIKYWPGKGNKFLLNSDDPTKQAQYFDEGSLAPFLDVDQNGIYSPEGGDYPVIKLIEDPTTGKQVGEFADQMIFWVINDVGNSHSNSSGAEIGLQINCLAFGFETSDEINDMTFYTYEIIKKTAGALEDTYMSVNVDPDLGEFDDDFIGCDINRSVGFCYNGGATDLVYGAGPPLVGIDFFEGPVFDDGVDSFELGLSTFMYYNLGQNPVIGDPESAQHYRNYQTGYWKDHSPTFSHPLTVGGTGISGSVETKFAYPGNPGKGEFWSECNMDGAGTKNDPDDRRFVQSSGPFTLSSDQTQRISIGVMIVETDPATYDGCADFEVLMGAADDKAQFLFDSNFGIVDGPDAPDLKIREMNNELIINLVNDPGTSNNFAEGYTSTAAGANTAIEFDSLYNFEGYIVYQLRNANITALDFDDESKAKVVFQSDVKNGVSSVYNYVFDDAAQMYVPVLKASGNDEGIVKSFKVTDDLFASGESALVNYKTYYYAVVAYAYNNYRQFVDIDPNHGTAQLEQYLQGRNNVEIYSAIPHDVSSESSGTVLNSVFGQGVVVERYEGRGNGGKSIELSNETKDAIVEDGFKDVISYLPLRDPLGVRIIDPLSVQDVDFELKVKNDLVNMVTDSSYWQLLVSKDGVVMDTINSNRKMDRPYDQILEDYGIVLSVGNPLSIDVNNTNNEPVYDLLSAEISFEDENKQWLSFLKDESAAGGLISPSNWILSGTYKNFTDEFLYNIYDSHQYDEFPTSNLLKHSFYDANGVYGKMLDGGFAPYCMSSNFLEDKGNIMENPNDDTEFSPFSTYGPAFLWDEYSKGASDTIHNAINTLDRLQSIDIVMTADKSKWSKCVVFETSEETEYSIDGAKKGQLRSSTSIDMDGNEISGETGTSYFPGYAINIETGERLNIAFGESSERIDNNGGDMIWNPTSTAYDKFTKIFKTNLERPVFGGKHFIYVFETRYDEGQAVKAVFDADYNVTNSPNVIPASVKDIYEQIMYTSIPMLNEDFELLSLADGLIPVSDTIRIRVQRPLETMYTSESDEFGSNDSLPRYGFSTDGLAPQTNVKEVAESVLDNIRVVPNPYYAFSSYENGVNSNIVKVTNLPDVCDVSIFTLDGKLVRKFERSLGSNSDIESNRQDLSAGQVKGVANLNNSLTWNLKNHKDIPVASGTYLIFVDAPDIGNKVVKSVVFVRPPDISNF